MIISTSLKYAVAVALTLITARNAFAQSDWIAGRDFAANEMTAFETSSTNTTVPAWSYGYRSTLASTTLTPYTTGQHQNSFSSNPDIQGFYKTDTDGPTTAVNTTNAPAALSGRLSLPALTMYTHPSNGLDFSITRWTAPTAGSYQISSNWMDLDLNGGNGASAGVTLNGVALFDNYFGSGSTTYTDTLLLDNGDILDFATGAAGNYTFDSTAFDATITPVPEPSTWCLLGGGLLALFGAQRRKSGKRQSI